MYVSLKTKLLTRKLIICFFIISPGFAQDLPGWVLKGADSEIAISAVAEAPTKIEALIKALGELSIKVDSRADDQITTLRLDEDGQSRSLSNSQSNSQFGNIKVESLQKMFVITDDSEKELESYFLENYKISAGDSLKSYEIKYFFEEMSSGGPFENSSYMEVAGKNFSFNDLLGGVRTAGLHISIHEADEHYYLMLVKYH